MQKNKKSRVFIIAEAGVNHNGSLRLAKRMIDKAKEAGADAVKFQTFKTENLVTPKAKKAEYQKENMQGDSEDTQFNMLKKLELGKKDFITLKKYCAKKSIQFLSTPFDHESADLLQKIKVSMYKIPSGEVTNLPFLIHIAKKKKPIILSTGMATLKEVKEAVKTIYSTGNKKLTILHCTTEYPAPFQDINLRAMLTLKKQCRCPVGYSDHTPGIEVAIAAVALGAEVIEKHFTLDKNMEGPDHKASLEPDELKQMVDSIRNVELALGDGVKKPFPAEKKVALIARKSVVAVSDVKKGEKLTKQDVAIKRPGDGILPKDLNRVIGSLARGNISDGDTLQWKMLIKKQGE